MCMVHDDNLNFSKSGGGAESRKGSAEEPTKYPLSHVGEEGSSVGEGSPFRVKATN